MKRLIGLLFILTLFSSCYAQDEYEFLRKGEGRTYIGDSLLIERAARAAADLLKINIADSATYFYKRGYLDALFATKQATIPNLTDTSKYVEFSDSSSQWYKRGYIDALLNLKLTTSDTSAFVSDALLAALLAYKLNIADSASYFYARTYIDALLNLKLSLSGGTMTGLLYDTVTTQEYIFVVDKPYVNSYSVPLLYDVEVQSVWAQITDSTVTIMLLYQASEGAGLDAYNDSLLTENTVINDKQYGQTLTNIKDRTASKGWLLTLQVNATEWAGVPQYEQLRVAVRYKRRSL